MKELYMNFWVFFIWNIKPERINLKIKKIKKKKNQKKTQKKKSNSSLMIVNRKAG